MDLSKSKASVDDKLNVAQKQAQKVIKIVVQIVV